MAEGLTQDGWIEPKRTIACEVCGNDYTVTGVIDIRENGGYCPDCEKEYNLTKTEGE